MIKNREDKTRKEDVEMISTPMFRLKDKKGRNYQIINLKTQFGFSPEVIIIEKVAGKRDQLIVRGFIKKEDINEGAVAKTS